MQDRYNASFPSFSWICKNHSRFFAFGFGSGLIRPGSGTWGTLMAWLLWFSFLRYFDNLTMGCLLVIGFFYGCWVCQSMEIELNTNDHVGIVFDEIVSFVFILWVLKGSFLIELLSFIIFRFFDIIKPPPIKYVDRVFKSGFGVMLDDLMAAIYTIAVVLLINKIM
ncbi:phosphatidylglycerophosphatase A family protein [Candidatus Kinetoplastidibacterium crithidiae]|uniref:Phosphatidylglycerophosphatase A n=1 Tax=Candidatus Kinetoplastidibacterium crithidiae TCC036E TaxID=1208918 RepID=M1LTX9_9PROT|nr:phosphatidylglycerophosphatase A [Candidatus Kinetoplastibacterium crithidii]AFZ82781.1 phosphatidylglycerophosphatase [Candidatus Kinetoplastibacterium crithidii (ex Angomonas deanei ATCC 30255)]AGF47566.1 phosphatidylglycerophosphatase A [Candidatus Kinetoplastibacterium crithidii TCC036E]